MLLVAVWLVWSVSASAQFQDILPSDPYAGTVELMYARTITAGCSAVPLYFCADPATSPLGPSYAYLTRGQAAIFFIRSLYSVTNGDGDPNNFPYDHTNPHFSDVPATHPYFKWIQRMSELGITAGCGGGQYCPDSMLPNWQAAVFTFRVRVVKESGAAQQTTFTQPALGPCGTAGSFNGYALTSYSCTPWYSADPVDYRFGWIQKVREFSGAVMQNVPGCTVQGSFCPDNNITRGAVSFMLVYGVMDQAPLAPNTVPGGSGRTILPHFTFGNCDIQPYYYDGFFGSSLSALYMQSQTWLLPVDSRLWTTKVSNATGSFNGSIIFPSTSNSGGGYTIVSFPDGGDTFSITANGSGTYLIASQHEWKSNVCGSYTPLQGSDSIALQVPSISSLQLSGAATPGSPVTITINGSGLNQQDPLLLGATTATLTSASGSISVTANLSNVTATSATVVFQIPANAVTGSYTLTVFEDGITTSGLSLTVDTLPVITFI